MNTEVFANSYSNQLASPCGLSDSSINVVSSTVPSSLSTGRFRIVIDNEEMIVTGGQGTTTWNVLRGAEAGLGGGAAATHAAGETISHYLTAGALTQIAQRPSKVIDLMLDYGAKFDGTTDDTAAWQAAANAIQAAGGGGHIHVPPYGKSIISSTIDFTRVGGVTISANAAGGFEAANCEVQFTGASGPMFSFFGADGVYLEGIFFTVNNALFAGDLIAFDWPISGGGQDCIYNRIERCAFKTRLGIPNSMVRMNKTIISTIKDCHFWGAYYAGIMFGNNAASPPANQNNQYINVVQVQGCSFNSGVWAHILFQGIDIEQVTVRDCTFEGCPGVLPLASPTGFAASAVGSGGSFAAGTYYWKITAVNSYGETLASSEVNATIALNGSANLSWSAVTGASGYRIYRSTSSNGESTSPALVTAISSGSTTSFTDTGAATTTGAIPSYNTTGGGGAIAGPIPNQATFQHINIEDCWFGDASFTKVPWINYLKVNGTASTGPSRIVGCTFYENGPTAYPMVSVDGPWTVENNYFEQPISSGYLGSASFILKANNWNASGSTVIAQNSIWRTQAGVSYGVPTVFASVGDAYATVQWSTFGTPSLGSNGLVINTIYQGSGAVQSRYMGAISSGYPTDSRQHSNQYDFWGPDSNGNFWACIAAGTPGSFVRSGPAAVMASNTQTNTTYTCALSDVGAVVEATNAAASTFTIPPNSSVAFPVGSIIRFWCESAGGLTISPGAGVTLHGTTSLSQYQGCAFRQRATNEWVAV